MRRASIIESLHAMALPQPFLATLTLRHPVFSSILVVTSARIFISGRIGYHGDCQKKLLYSVSRSYRWITRQFLTRRVAPAYWASAYSESYVPGGNAAGLQEADSVT